MAGTGTATLAFSNSNETTVDVTGQTGILSGSAVEAFMMGDTTADHSADEHLTEPIELVCGNIVAGTGFTIYARLRDGRADGSYTVHWAWA